MNDLEFIQRCVRRNKSSWEEFVDRYSRLIYSCIKNILNSKYPAQFSQDDFNDLFQEIFLWLCEDNFKKLKSFKAKNGCSFPSWLRQVVVNYTLDYLRRFQPTVSMDRQSDEGISLSDLLTDESSAKVSDVLSGIEKLAQLKECIRKLETEDKYFLELHLNQGMSLEELKRVFRISRGAIDMRKSRIIDRLKNCFKDKGFLLDF